ncbi:hypothetical protein DP49_6593 [Burkholderia pseudomallei]|nr:hypothetical protein DP49_6593 [Burkholderia pseudomallei]
MIWPIALRVASFGGKPSSAITRSTFSTTTIASSTSRPIASTRPNIDSTLIEKPTIDMIANVPSSTTGTAIVGMIVARRFCRNRYITRNTRTIPSSSVFTTSSIDRRTNGVVSYGYLTTRPCGKYADISSIFARTAFAVASAFALVASWMPSAAVGWPLYFVSKLYVSPPRPICATSFSRTCEPS